MFAIISRNGEGKMKNKTAKFIALLLAVFIFPLSFSACKSGNTELSAESVADICIENRQVWEFGENSVGNCGYCFIDLDFDGMPELVSTSTQGSGLFTTDFFYKINAEKSAVESLPLSGNGNSDFKLNAAQDGDYMKLLRDGDGNMFYFFCSYARASAGNYAVSYSRVTVSGGKVTAKIIWSSKNYDYMKVNDEKYDAVIENEHSTFEIPVAGFDWAMPVVADTTAMSEPHEIEYTLRFDSASIAPAAK